MGMHCGRDNVTAHVKQRRQTSVLLIVLSRPDTEQMKEGKGNIDICWTMYKVIQPQCLTLSHVKMCKC